MPTTLLLLWLSSLSSGFHHWDLIATLSYKCIQHIRDAFSPLHHMELPARVWWGAGHNSCCDQWSSKWRYYICLDIGKSSFGLHTVLWLDCIAHDFGSIVIIYLTLKLHFRVHLSSTYTKMITTQRRLAWPHANSWSVPCSHNSPVGILTLFAD